MNAIRDRPSLPVPDNPRAQIWRYMNFAKFVSMLDTGALFFAYAERFMDAAEGEARATDTDPRVAVSSWHQSEHESEGMWRLYSPIEEAVAIQSIYERLRRVLPADVLIHQVQYLDAPERVSRSDPRAAYFYKRKAYEHEKELRAVLGPHSSSKEGVRWETPAGWFVKVAPEAMVERLYVSPFASDWFYDVVEGVMRRYQRSFALTRSALSGTVRAR